MAGDVKQHPAAAVKRASSSRGWLPLPGARWRATATREEADTDRWACDAIRISMRGACKSLPAVRPCVAVCDWARGQTASQAGRAQAQLKCERMQ